MTGSMTRLAVVGSDAEPSDATTYLLDLLAWLHRRHPEVQLHVFLLRGGPLVHRFHDLASTTVVNWYDRREEHLGVTVAVRDPDRREWLAFLLEQVGPTMVRWRLPRTRPDVVVFSGVEALEAASSVISWRQARLVHLPEFSGGPPTQLRCWPMWLTGAAAALVESPDAITVLKEAGLAPQRIVVVPTLAPRSPPTPEPAPTPEPTPTPEPEGSLVVGGWGAPGWARGVDLFIRVAWAIQRSAPELDVHFRWGGCERDEFDEVLALATSVGLGDRFTWSGVVDLGTWATDIDIFVATERLPEVSSIDLAAAAAGAPFVAFDVAERLPAGGRVVPYPDVDALAHELEALCRSTAQGDELAREGTAFIDAEHSVEVIGPMVWAEIERCLQL